MESAPQAYILLTFAYADDGIADDGSGGVGDLNSWGFWVPLSLSATAATFGIAKFLKSGPTRIVGNYECLRGFGSLTFILIFFNVAATLVGKGFAIGRETALLLFPPRDWNITCLMILLNFLPQLVHVG